MVQLRGFDYGQKILGPLFLRAARPVRHRVGQSYAALVEHHETTERREAGGKTRRDPIFCQQLERKERTCDHDDVDSTRLADDAGRNVGLTGSGGWGITHRSV